MSNFLLSKSEQGIVVFHIWKSLKYKQRLVLSFILILAGFAIQIKYFDNYLIPGMALVLAGNLLLLAKGYDTRIKLQGFKPDAEWVKTDLAHLSEIAKMNDKLKKWDVSSMDVTSTRGCLLFVLIIVAIIVIIASKFLSPGVTAFIGINAAILILPHWLTGLKRISTTPVLLTKIKIFENLVNGFQKELEQETVNFLMLVDHKTNFPTDVKMKVSFKNQPEEFMGFYAQISMNNVQGTLYPYFYVVLVAKEKSKLLSKQLNKISLPENVIKEFETESDMEIIVIRQTTTKTSGYNTKDKAILNIFKTGLETVKRLSIN